MQRSVATWEALDREKTRIWETAYVSRPLYEPWPTWYAWLAESRALLVITREVSEAHDGQKIERCLP